MNAFTFPDGRIVDLSTVQMVSQIYDCGGEYDFDEECEFHLTINGHSHPIHFYSQELAKTTRQELLLQWVR